MCFWQDDFSIFFSFFFVSFFFAFGKSPCQKHNLFCLFGNVCFRVLLTTRNENVFFLFHHDSWKDILFLEFFFFLNSVCLPFAWATREHHVSNTFLSLIFKIKVSHCNVHVLLAIFFFFFFFLERKEFINTWTWTYVIAGETKKNKQTQIKKQQKQTKITKNKKETDKNKKKTDHWTNKIKINK